MIYSNLEVFHHEKNIENNFFRTSFYKNRKNNFFFRNDEIEDSDEFLKHNRNDFKIRAKTNFQVGRGKTKKKNLFHTCVMYSKFCIFTRTSICFMVAGT